jgi:adenylate cyclase
MFDRVTLSQRTGVSLDELDRMVELGVLEASAGTQFTEGDRRRAIVIQEFERGGLPLEKLSEAMRANKVSLAFVDEPGFERFASLAGETFADLAQSTGLPVGLLLAIREAMGFAQPEPTDRVRADEVDVVTLASAMSDAGVPIVEIDRAMRSYGESARRIAETENFWFQEYVIGAFLRSGRPWSEMAEALGDSARRINAAGDPAVIAMIHGRQTRTWIQAMFDSFESFMAEQGIIGTADQQPAICFLDLTGYTRLTEQHGDAAAADLAGNLARLVQRSAVNHGGKAVKWLGDGVMFHFRTPGPAVVAALEMVKSSSEAGLPPAHVGVHTGPVLFQEGDYFGRTVNAASRIADYARPGEVLVTREVADATDPKAVNFAPIGPVQLKGLTDDLYLLAASRAAETSGTG